MAMATIVISMDIIITDNSIDFDELDKLLDDADPLKEMRNETRGFVVKPNGKLYASCVKGKIKVSPTFCPT